jgi:hypothetical protein
VPIILAGKESGMKLSSAQTSQSALSTATPSTAAQPRAFRHQPYTAQSPRVPHYYLRASLGPAIGTREFQRRMHDVGKALHAAGVCVIYLVHSSFAALDSASILAAVARHYRAGGSSIRRIAAKLVDADSHNAGNYTFHYAGLLEATVGDDAHPLPVRLVSWSSENHHLGRADAAVRMIDELAAVELPPGQRVMFWGHGHAGNVFAIMSQLLSADTAAVEQFFDAAAVYYRWPFTGLIDIPVWHRVRQLLTRDRERLLRRPCDWVTFGTPVRYGWKMRDGDNLLHFIHHRPAAAGPAHLAVFPPRTEEVLDSAYGDYLQQVGIAGTDDPPSPLVWRSWLADRRLGRLFSPDDEPADLAGRLQTGMRVPDCGTSLLVDYGVPSGAAAEQLAGHAVYTRLEWMLFHAEQIVERLFGGTNDCCRAA